MNHWTGIGRLTADPELKMTQSEKSVTTFNVAIDRPYKGQNGEKQTDFLPVVAWGKTAEFVTKYFRKGSMIAVEGAVNIRSYTDQNGAKRYVTEINAEKVHFCGGNSQNNTDTNQNASATFAPPNMEEFDVKSDDLPF